MDALKKNHLTVFVLWLLIVPAGMTYVLINYPPVNPDWLTMIAFLGLALVTVYFPLNLNGSYLSLEQWVGVAVFLKYGLSAELLISQLIILPLLFRSRNSSSTPLINRYFFNSLMFFILSIASGYVFIILGGQFGSLDLYNLLFFGFIYQLTSTIFNQVILNFYLRSLGHKVSMLSVETVWDYLAVVFIFPFSITLYLLEAYVGVISLLIMGVPFVVVAYLLQKYNNTERINANLRTASKIGHQLADRLTSEEVFRLFLTRVVEMLNNDYAYILDIRKDSNKLVLIRSYEKGELLTLDVPPLAMGEGIGGLVWKENKPVIFKRKEEWEGIVSGYIPENVQSIIAAPISRNQEIEGVLLIASEKRFAFEEYQLKIIDLLCSYFAVSLEKAKYVQDAISKSERCGLTKLYNYRYLDDKIEQEMSRLMDGQLRQLSLIMMDIDRFKMVNDTYGHQSGNDILVGLARLLEQEVGNLGTLARYGGEEFVVLLPDYSKGEALKLAETIRQIVENHPFRIQSDLSNERETQDVQITLSIGVSTAPEDSDEAMALIRNADRALYIGAKREGRNRVAEYVK
ncbi:sensor domain-containing diguanylate cyclase [Chungangia koreensis]|uniref:Sensor domain-containing diguanylate cyclase n=1 Tax=Chungangia koreensis TaxID=752657 RepID=A0ABV8X1V9_9LACT